MQLAQSSVVSTVACARAPVVSAVEARFLPVWLVCVAADWLQGPYLYSLYADRGCTQGVIAKLFAVGFVSSGTLGPAVGGSCDRVGRRFGCLLYCAVTLSACLLTHSTALPLLVLGRLLGGVGDSLLYSCFEVWAISEFRRQAQRSPSTTPLDRLLGRMWLGSWLVAMGAGLAAGAAVRLAPARRIVAFGGAFGGVSLAVGGPAAAFDLAALCCLLGLVLIFSLWRERRGQEPHEVRPRAADGDVTRRVLRRDRKRCRPGSWRDGAVSLGAEIAGGKARVMAAATAYPRVFLCGAVVAAFEGSMFVFVFCWSPVLLAGRPDLAPSLGLVFSAFMLCCAGGSSAFQALFSRRRPEQLISIVLVVAAFALLGASVAARSGAVGAPVALMCFLVFELCIGVYFPCVSALKSECVPESIRNLVYSLYRVPVNALALAVLFCAPSRSRALASCAAALLLAAVFVAPVFRRRPGGGRRGDLCPHQSRAGFFA